MRTLEDHPNGKSLTGFLSRYWRAGTFPTDLSKRSVANEPEAQVRANHGRWVVDCPFCPSAQLASDVDRRFMCPDCGNQTVNGKWLRVDWPTPEEREQVEELLDVRPTPQSKNWRRPETVQDLADENAERGL